MKMNLFLLSCLFAAALVAGEPDFVWQRFTDCRDECKMNTCEVFGHLTESSDQMLSCVNACYLRHMGASTNECLGYCDRTGVSGCDLFVKDEHFKLCSNRDVRGSDCGAPKKSECELGCTSYPEIEECKGNPDTFDAGYGLCDTYHFAHHKNNHDFCDNDMNAEGLTASEVCGECGKCIRSAATQGLCTKHGVKEDFVKTIEICEDTEEVCEAYIKKSNAIQTGFDYCESIGLTCIGLFEDDDSCVKKEEYDSCSMAVPRTRDHIVRCGPKEKGFWGEWSQCVETSPNSCTRSRDRVCPTEGVPCWGNGPSHEEESCACPPPPGLCAQRFFRDAVSIKICEDTDDVCEVYVKKGINRNQVNVQTGFDYCESIGLTCLGMYEDQNNNCQKIMQYESCAMDVGETSDFIARCGPAERSFSFLAWDSQCRLEENNARDYVPTKARRTMYESEQACEQFCYDWDECTAFSFGYSDTNSCVAFKQCILEPATVQLNQGEFRITRSSKPFPGLNSQDLKSFPFMAEASVCHFDDHTRWRQPTGPVASEQACAEFCSDWDECIAYSFLSIEHKGQKLYCTAFSVCDRVSNIGTLPLINYVITRLTTPLPQEETYDIFAFSQCKTSNTPFPGDRADNPIFGGGGFDMVGTADACMKKCADPNTVDSHGRPCVAVEHSSQDPLDVASCAFAWDCSEIGHWGGGKVYRKTESSKSSSGNSRRLLQLNEAFSMIL